MVLPSKTWKSAWAETRKIRFGRFWGFDVHRADTIAALRRVWVWGHPGKTRCRTLLPDPPPDHPEGGKGDRKAIQGRNDGRDANARRSPCYAGSADSHVRSLRPGSSISAQTGGQFPHLACTLLLRLVTLHLLAYVFISTSQDTEKPNGIFSMGEAGRIGVWGYPRLNPDLLLGPIQGNERPIPMDDGPGLRMVLHTSAVRERVPGAQGSLGRAGGCVWGHLGKMRCRTPSQTLPQTIQKVT